MSRCCAACRDPQRPLLRQRGAGLAEFVVIAPTVLAMCLAMLQFGLVFHARGSLHYAAFEGARAAALEHAAPAAARQAMVRALTPFYGGGRDLAELVRATARARADLDLALQIEILSPTRESFDDYHSPAAARTLGTRARVIPAHSLGLRDCPPDRQDCAADPAHNRSGQTLADANLLKLRLTWGLPARAQVPLAGRFFVWAVRALNPGDQGSFRHALLQAGRIPVVAHATVRMQSDAIESAAVVSSPGPGNAGQPGAAGETNDPDRPTLPPCAAWDPLCAPADGDGDGDGAGSDGDGGNDNDPSPGGGGTSPPADGDTSC